MKIFRAIRERVLKSFAYGALQVGTFICSTSAYAVPADQIDWGWPTPPTFPNEAYGPRTDVDPELIGDNQLFDVWAPDGDGPYPVMIYAHGGGFRSGSKVKAIGSRPKLAKNNVVFISINYTLKQGPAKGIQDGIDAINHVKANHEKYKIDPEKIFLSGNSAGGIMMNHIIFDRKMPGILGAWHGAYFRTQFADLSIDNLREVGIPIAISMGKLYPADPGHSPLAAVTLLEKNVTAGNSGMWIGSTDGNVEQVWLNGKWIKNASDGIDTGESYPEVAEWIYSTIDQQTTTPTPQRTARPNVLFIVSDDHGWGDLPSNWDKTEVRLPTLDALATHGVRFPNYHTVPLCGPSRACMFTGQYSTENGMWRGPGKQPLGSPGYRGIKRDVKMLSEHLSEAGYKTGAFGKWHMGEHEGEVPNDRGFDEFHGFLKGAHPYWIKPGRSKIMHNREPDRASEGHATELFTQWAESFIRKHAAKDDPFFCYLAYNAVHGPLRTDESKPASAPEVWVKKALDRGVSFLRSDYVAILEHMDHNIGRLVDLLDGLGIADNTLIVFVSDNGGCTMEEGAAGGRFPGNNGPFSGGKATTFQGGLNVPFLMSWKGRLPQGMISDDQVMHCDIFATLLDAAGIAIPKMNGKNPVRGTSLMPHMLSAGKNSIPERSMIFELWGNIGLRKGDYKLWADIGRDYSPDWDALSAKLTGADLALFDLNKDVAEKNDLRMKRPEVYASLKTELIDHLTNINPEYPGSGNSAVLPKENSTPKKTTAAPAPNRTSQDQFFKSRDLNQDGAITLQEFIGNPKGRNVHALTKRFKKFDANDDGKLRLDELQK